MTVVTGASSPGLTASPWGTHGLRSGDVRFDLNRTYLTIYCLNMTGQMWQRLGAVVVALASLVLMAPSAQARPDFVSFFEGDPVVSGAGWAACESPLTWSVDTAGLGKRVARLEIRHIKEAWGIWADAGGFRVSFAGRQALDFNPVSYGLRRRDGAAAPDRHVYLAFKSSRQVPIMDRNILGLAMPTVVMLPTREIVGGMSIFRRGFVVQEGKRRSNRLMHLYLHEIGHTLGLGHARGSDNVMHPSLGAMHGLGPGDQRGIRQLTRSCMP